MSNVCSLAVILVFLVVTWWLVLVTWWSLLATACYLVVTGGYWSLLLVTAHSHFKINGLSILLSYYLSRCFLGIGLLGFSEFWHGATNLIKLCMTEPDFLEKLFFAPEMEKWGHKQG